MLRKANHTIFILESTELAGGIKVVFQAANHLASTFNTMDVEVFALGPQPLWRETDVPVRTFGDYQALVSALTPIRANKVATFWRTARPVASSARSGEGYYLVQDIETCFYTDDDTRANVVATYDLPLQLLATSQWVSRELERRGKRAAYIGLGIDHTVFERLSAAESLEERIVLVNAPRKRSLWSLKGMDLLLAALSAIKEARADLKIWSYSPHPLSGGFEQVVDRHWEQKSDPEVAELYRRASCFLITSFHEGFCLPALEAMACGTPVVTTAADGNLEFCLDGETCLITESEPRAVARSVIKLIEDPPLKELLRRGGLQISQRYDWLLAGKRLERALRSGTRRA
jgi:glycosyltransferase involved in cell wall biosynthesis